MKSRRQLQLLIFLIFAVSILIPVLASARKTAAKGPPTNVAFMEKTASAAVDSLIRAMPFPLSGPVRLRTVMPHDASWMIESLFGGELREKGVQIIVSEVPLVAAAVIPAEAESSSVTDTTKLIYTPPPVETGGLSLEYRITELGMGYPRAWRPHLIGRKLVERVGIASLSGRLIDESTGKLLWVGEGSATQKDIVSVSRLSSLEGNSQSWQKGTLPTGKTGAFVEPLVVAAIVAGLVYLFYSNKE